MWYLSLLIAGFLPLIVGANQLVDDAPSLIKRLDIPDTGIKQFYLTFVSHLA